MNCVITYFKDHEENEEPIEIKLTVEGKANRQTVKEANDKADAIMRERGLEPDDYPDVDIDMGEIIDWT